MIPPKTVNEFGKAAFDEELNSILLIFSINVTGNVLMIHTCVIDRCHKKGAYYHTNSVTFVSGIGEVHPTGPQIRSSKIRLVTQSQIGKPHRLCADIAKVKPGQSFNQPKPKSVDLLDAQAPVCTQI